MKRLLADANVRRAIVRGLLRRRPKLDIVRAQKLGFEETPDPDLLEWAAREGRVLITHDVRTMPAHAYARMQEGKLVAGIIEVNLEHDGRGVLLRIRQAAGTERAPV